jgi:hypothetical protein
VNIYKYNFRIFDINISFQHSIIEASKELNIYSSNISKCCNNKIKSCNSYIPTEYL